MIEMPYCGCGKRVVKQAPRGSGAEHYDRNLLTGVPKSALPVSAR